MALSSEQKRVLRIAIADAGIADAIAAAVDSQGSGPAGVVAALTENGGALGGSQDGDIATLTATYTARTGSLGGSANGSYVDEGTITTAGGNTYADAAVNTVIGKVKDNLAEANAMIAQLAADNVALRDAARENASKINAILSSLKSAGLMSSS